MTPAGQKTNPFDSEHYVEGYAARFAPYLLFEHDGIKIYEQIDTRAFDDADMVDVMMLYNHDGRVLARKSNNTLETRVDNDGLFVSADLSKTSASRELYEDISQDMVNKMSWGFRVAEAEFDKQTRTRIIKKIKRVYEVSAVSIPANDSTGIEARSYVDAVREAEDIERRRRVLKMKIDTII